MEKISGLWSSLTHSAIFEVLRIIVSMVAGWALARFGVGSLLDPTTADFWIPIIGFVAVVGMMALAIVGAFRIAKRLEDENTELRSLLRIEHAYAESWREDQAARRKLDEARAGEGGPKG